MAVSGRVVVLRALGLGDLLTGLPALRAVRRHFTGHGVVLAMPRWLAELGRHAGAADEVVDVQGLRPLPGRLGGPDVAVNLHGRGPQSHRLLRALRPGRLLAFANEEAAVGGPAWRADEHEVRRWCRMVGGHGIPADPADLDIDRPEADVPAGVAGATVIHPGAKDAARRWPPDRWAAVARAERDAGRAVLVTGSRGERELARLVARAAGLDDRSVLAGRTSVLELAAVVADAGRVVCGDTGVAHLATALRAPSVVLFGPTPPRLWGPPPDRPWHVALWTGRTGDPHGRRPHPGLLEIGASDVVAALAALPDRVVA